MLRHLYLILLRLHPVGFRQRFGDEMLSIFEQEQDNFAASHLLLDGLFSLTRQWALRPEFWREVPISHAETPAPEGVPLFVSLDPFHPRYAAVIYGTLLSIALFCSTCFAIRYSWIRILHLHIPQVQFDQPQRTIARSETATPSPSRSVSPIGEKKSTPVSSAVSLQQPTAVQPLATNQPAAQEVGPPSMEVPFNLDKSSRETAAFALPGKFVASVPSPTVNVPLDAYARKRVIDGAISNLKWYYIDPVVAGKMAAALRSHEQAGDDNEATDGKAFAALLTTQLRAVSHDRHIQVNYSQSVIPAHVPGPSLEEIARYQREMDRTNCTLEAVTILPQNVGYLKLNSFPDLQLCQGKVAAAMSSLNQADAIIFDLRENHGGVPGMVAFLASYLFDHPTHLESFYTRYQNSTLQSWTLSPVDENRLAHKPAFVLTSAETFSGGEEFAYDLKMLKRATLVGETTAGGAHMVRRRRIDDHFSIGVPDTGPINPVSNTNWEGIGVTPDVAVEAANALKIAQSLAEKALQK